CLDHGISKAVLDSSCGFGRPAFPRHMSYFIGAVEHIEARNPNLKPLDVVKGLREISGLDDMFTQHYLGRISDRRSGAALLLDSEVSQFLGDVIQHRVTDRGEEEGVVLAHDGTTVALAPLLLGLEAGLLGKSGARSSGLHALTLTQMLGRAFLGLRGPALTRGLGTKGCWNNLVSPKVFTLSRTPSFMTDALINGGMDGTILGNELSGTTEHPLKLSSLLTGYYRYHAGPEGLNTAAPLISVLRRDNFKALVSPSVLQEQVLDSLRVYWTLRGDVPVEDPAPVVKQGVEIFMQTHTACPTIISRCEWGAAPYRGTPTQLTLPLSYMYIHHTYEPGEPCVSFEQCAAAMRSMQRYHQESNGWDDIGYSFVAGSDGYIYEGRGWYWQGAHTGGYNSKGYGVAIIGDFTVRLPSQHTLNLVKDELPACAVSGGRLVPTYIVHGHRQMVATECPGNALYEEIGTWPHFCVSANDSICAIYATLHF
uniref:Peptidoglycan recognition protein 6 n=1 Tax=Scleropages formosus TaxID=113540 RepID=A0A8C9TIL5_SCLFO